MTPHTPHPGSLVVAPRKHLAGLDRRPKLSSSKIAQLKTLYLVKGLPPSEIAQKLNITPKAVYRWIYRLKLSKQRDVIKERVEAKALTKATTEAEDAIARWSPQIEELGDDTLDLARSEVANPNKLTAKNLQALSGAMRNWSAMVTGFSGINLNGNALPSVNIFLGSLERAVPVTVTADPAIDV